MEKRVVENNNINNLRNLNSHSYNELNEFKKRLLNKWFNEDAKLINLDLKIKSIYNNINSKIFSVNILKKLNSQIQTLKLTKQKL
jgi:hypothetical protein